MSVSLPGLVVGVASTALPSFGGKLGSNIRWKVIKSFLGCLPASQFPHSAASESQHAAQAHLGAASSMSVVEPRHAG